MLNKNKKILIIKMSLPPLKQKKYFSLIDKSIFSTIVEKNEQKDSIKATAALLKINKFIYLDMNASILYFVNQANGFKVMEINKQPESDEQDQKIGPYVVSEGIKTSRQKIKLKQFMTINYNIRQKQNLIRQKVKKQLDKSKKKIVTLENNHKKSCQQIKLYPGLQNQKFDKIKNTLEIEQINADILKKQEKMMQKLGIVADFQSFKQKNTSSYLEKGKKAEKYFLPRILKPFS